MARLLPIASGKGGVGKSVIAANLGLALARAGSAPRDDRRPNEVSGGGRAVVLVDLDLGGSNLHTFLGVRNNNPGLGALVWKREKSISDLLVETGFERLWLVPGDGLLPGTANLEWSAKKRILKGLEALPADFVILDLGAGSSYNIVDFFLASNEGLVAIRPEITSVLNAYAFLKTVAFRILSRSFPERSPGRSAVNDFAASKGEGGGQSFLDFARELASRFPEGAQAFERLSTLRPRAVMNMGKEPGDAELGYRLRDIAAKNLGLKLEFSGYLLDDPAVPPSIAARRPLFDIDPSSPFSRGVRAMAARLAASPASGPLELHDGDEDDIVALMEESADLE
jgi:flagellar biosynthesis protein FlhG